MVKDNLTAVLDGMPRNSVASIIDIKYVFGPRKTSVVYILFMYQPFLKPFFFLTVLRLECRRTWRWRLCLCSLLAQNLCCQNTFFTAGARVRKVINLKSTESGRGHPFRAPARQVFCTKYVPLLKLFALFYTISNKY